MSSLFPVKSGGASGYASAGLHGKYALTFRHMVETTVDQTQITKMHKDRRRAEREHVKLRKKLSSTVETEHLPAATMASTQAGHISDDSFDAFHNAPKIPTLRTTPALIVWPQRPDVPSVDCHSSCSRTRLIPQHKNKALPQESQIIGDIKSRKSKQNSELPDVNEYQKRNSRETTCMPYIGDDVTRSRLVSVVNTPTRTRQASVVNNSTRTRQVSVVNNPQNKKLGSNEQDDETDVKFKPVADHDFWENTGTNIRIDSLGIGNPRPDPYHSTWGRDERRCFFLSPLSKPPHIREPFFKNLKKIPPKAKDDYITPYITPYTITGRKSFRQSFRQSFRKSFRKSLTSEGEQPEAH